MKQGYKQWDSQKITSRSGMHKTRYHNGSYLLFGKG